MIYMKDTNGGIAIIADTHINFVESSQNEPKSVGMISISSSRVTFEQNSTYMSIFNSSLSDYYYIAFRDIG